MMNAMQTFLAERRSQIYETVFKSFLLSYFTPHTQDPNVCSKNVKKCCKKIRKDTRETYQIIWLLLVLHIHQNVTDQCLSKG